MAEPRTISAWNGYRRCLSRKREKRRLVSRVYSLLMGMAVTYRLILLLIVWKMAFICLLCLLIARIFYNLSTLVSSPLSNAPTATKRTRFFGSVLSEFRSLSGFKCPCDQEPKPLLLVTFSLDREEQFLCLITHLEYSIACLPNLLRLNAQLILHQIK